MKPITNILLLLTLVAYVFLPLFEISLLGNTTGLQFTASMVTANLSFGYTLYSLVPFLLVFAAIAFNSLKNRYWGVLVSILIFGVLYYFATLTRVFQGFSLVHDPDVAADTQLAEGMPIIGVGMGFYVSFVLTVLSFISALVSLMPFKFNKRLEDSIDRRFESGKKQISKVSHGIHDEFHKRGKNKNEEGVLKDDVDLADSPLEPTSTRTPESSSTPESVPESSATHESSPESD